MPPGNAADVAIALANGKLLASVSPSSPSPMAKMAASPVGDSARNRQRRPVSIVVPLIAQTGFGGNFDSGTRIFQVARMASASTFARYAKRSQFQGRRNKRPM
jgi:hypothetical protein